LADERTEDIILNPDSLLWVRRQGEGFEPIGEMPPAQAQTAMGTIAAQRGTVINYDQPFLEAELQIDGSRFEGIIPPVTSRPVFAIRLRPRRVFTLDDYAIGGILSNQSDPLNRSRRRGNFLDSVRGLSHAEVIRAAVKEKKNILVVGSTGSGKTTLVNAVLEALARIAPRDRVITIEDTMEFAVPGPELRRLAGNRFDHDAGLSSGRDAPEAEPHRGGRGRMTAEEESRETKQEQDEGWHEPRFLDYMVI
jgi:type IV secretion system protein VirB11